MSDKQPLSEGEIQHSKKKNITTHLKHDVSFDYLRVFIAYLGIILHAALIILIVAQVAKYPANILPTGLPNAITQLFLGFDIISIHFFRMAIFFLLAGYFAYYQLHSRSLSQYIQNRLLRILLPLILFFFLSNVPNLFLAVAQYVREHQAITLGQFNDLSYLWFLYYLLGFYALLLILRICTPKNYSARFLELILTLRLKPLIFALITILITLGSMAVQYQFVYPFQINMHLFGYYFIFFLFGYGLKKLGKDLSNFRRDCGWYLLAAVSLQLIITHSELIDLFALIHQQTVLSSLLLTVLHNLSTWCWVFGLMGLFSYCQKFPRLIRVLAKSTYWVYLTHFPILLVIVPPIFQCTQSTSLSFIYAIIITTILVLGSFLAWYGLRQYGDKLP